jgi:hypothetical protein
VRVGRSLTLPLYLWCDLASHGRIGGSGAAIPGRSLGDLQTLSVACICPLLNLLPDRYERPALTVASDHCITGALPGLRQRLGLGLGLRIANGLRQHLLKFGLGLCWFPPLRLKCVHENNMVMRQAELEHLRPRRVTS